MATRLGENTAYHDLTKKETFQLPCEINKNGPGKLQPPRHLRVAPE